MTSQTNKPLLTNSVSEGAEHRFEFRIDGDGVNPLSVPLFKLLEILRRANAAIKAVGGTRVQEGLNLVNVDGGSLTCELAANEEAFAATDRLTEIIASDDLTDLPRPARDKVRQLWEYAVENEWEALSFCSVGGGVIFAEIRTDQDPPVGNAYKGITTIYGHCDRVGSEKRPTAKIHLINKEIVFARLASKELAQQLGERLFQVVGLEGEATWDNETHKLIAFKAERLSPFRDRDEKDKPRTISEAFQHLAEAAGDRWENTDPNEFIKELRDE